MNEELFDSATRGITGAILAAGFSRRLGRPKQLLEYRGKPLLQWAVDAALASELDEVLVVLGESAPVILERIDLGRARVIVNEHAIEGQSSSIVAATSMADPHRTGTLLMLGDQPNLTTDDLARVLTSFDGQPDSIAMASWQGEARSPVIFGRAYDCELLALTGDTGARPLVRQHWDRVRLVEFDRPVPSDIDTEADYQRLLADSNLP
jgi:molybdenum cofactor cytidylyltransferase